MKIGDLVVIKVDVYEPQYSKTDAVVVKYRPSAFEEDFGKEYMLERHDGTFSHYFEKHLCTYDEYYYSGLPKISDRYQGYTNKAINMNDLPDLPDHGTPCRHDGKYLNVIDSTLKYYFCPDCGQDWDAY